MTYIIDAVASRAVWTGRRLTGSHEGTIQFSGGHLDVVDDVIDGGSFQFEVPSLRVTDLENPVLNEQLRTHLLSEDFFAADKYPQAAFTITSALPDNDGNYDVEGDLTMKGTTHPLRFDAFVVIDGQTLRANAEIVVDRTLYDMRFRSNKFFENLGDLIIYDDFVLNVDVVATAKKVMETEDLDLSNII